MTKKLRVNYEGEDFLTDESFTNYHFQLNTKDELSWKEWLANHPEKNGIATQARELIQTLSLTISDEDYKAELKKIKAAIDIKSSRPQFHFLNWNKNINAGKRAKRTLQYLLAALLIFAFAGYFFLRTNKNSAQLLVITNTKHENLVITLSDSTVVTLAPQSVLHYPEHFQPHERNVYLQGNAQFHVKRNETAPFKVYSENIVATVLGTIFNFKRSGDSITVELINGKLNVALNDKSSSQKSILLSPTEKATYVKQHEAFYKTSVSPLIDFHFQQNNFNEIAMQLKNAFGITVINMSNKKTWRFTGDFKNTTAQDVIENVCLVKGLSAEVKGDTIYIK